MRDTWFAGVLLAVVSACLSAAAPQFSSGLPPDPPGEKLANVSFEVVSIKENPATWTDAGPPDRSMSPSGQFSATRETVRRLIMVAYEVRDYQIVDAPKWIGDTRFDIAAKAPEGFSMSQTRAMLRRLLADHFALIIRPARRAMPTYSLEFIDNRRKLGSGIRASSADDCVPPPSGASSPVSLKSNVISPHSSQESTTRCAVVAGWRGDFIYIRQSPLSSLTELLASAAGRPVLDRTALRGNYDADIRVPGLIPGRPQMPDDRNPDSMGVSVFTAVREHLGMKLTAQKGDVDVLAIVRVERPKPN